MVAGVERFFLFTDIEGSTQLWERFPAAMRLALARHDALLREASLAHGGDVFKTIGDAFCVAFESPESCLRAAIDAQRALLSEDWGEVGAIKVRMALHGGEVEAREGDYFGPPLNKVSRLRDAGHGGQILVTAEIVGRLGNQPPARWLDRGRHRMRGIEEPTQLFQICDDALPREFPELRTESAHPHNLPRETSSFVGRRSGIVTVRNLLTETKARLVTLTGLGGSGKSRLALRIAGDILWRYEGGIWYLDAVELSRADELPAALLHACSLTEDPRKAPLAQLIEYFKNASALLVLDGVERFEELADTVAALLKGTEKLQVLATSRSLMYLSFEHEYPLESLTLPESVELFVERAIQVRHDFALTPENRAVVESLCERLEGVPLALELAAAQSRTLSPEQIREALSQRFALLSTRMRDLHPRHRSLHSAIDWSYQLLTEEEKRLFCDLSCFVGSFSEDAAAQICGPSAQIFDVSGTLAGLRDKSLLRLHSAPDQGVRYLLQDSLREFGAGQSTNEADPKALPLRHADYFRRLVEEQAATLRGAGQQQALSALEEDAPNIRAAQEYLLAEERLDDAARIVVGLGRFWEARGWLREGRDRLQRILEREATLGSDALRAELFVAAGRLEWNGAEPERAATALERCVALCATGDFSGAEQLHSMALTLLGMIAYSRGELSGSDIYYEQALALKTALGDEAGEATLRTNLGINAMTRGDHARAMELFVACLAFRQRVGDLAREAHAWNCIGACAQALEQRERAVEAFEKSLAMHEALGDPINAAHARINLGDLALQSSQSERARAHYEAALAALRPLEEWRGIIACQLGLADVALEGSDVARARAALREALELSRERGYQESLASTLELLARLVGSSQPTEAGEFIVLADVLRRRTGTPRPARQERLLAGLTPAPTPPDEASTLSVALCCVSA